jgi:hypothetical protein
VSGSFVGAKGVWTPRVGLVLGAGGVIGASYLAQN